MDYNEALERLWNHANMPTRGRNAEDSFVYTAWRIEQTKSPQDFQRLYDDILDCLSAVNSCLNGATPSETVAAGPQVIDRTLAYCMSGILSAGWRHYHHWHRRSMFDAPFLDQFGSMLVRIGIAWDQVLAGDIDDIRVDAEREFTIDQT